MNIVKLHQTFTNYVLRQRCRDEKYTFVIILGYVSLFVCLFLISLSVTFQIYGILILELISHLLTSLSLWGNALLFSLLLRLGGIIVWSQTLRNDTHSSFIRHENRYLGLISDAQEYTIPKNFRPWMWARYYLAF